MFKISSNIINEFTNTENAKPNDLKVGMPVTVPKIYPKAKHTLPIKNINGNDSTYFYSSSKFKYKFTDTISD